MYCPQCGNQFTERVNFCCHCGAALAVPVPVPAKRLMRSRTDCKIAGVCGGVAEYFDVDPTLVRIIWLMLAVLWGWGIFGYCVAWIVMPKEPVTQSATAIASMAAPQPAGSHSI